MKGPVVLTKCPIDYICPDIGNAMVKSFLSAIFLVLFLLPAKSQDVSLPEDSLRTLLQAGTGQPSPTRVRLGIALMGLHVPGDKTYDSLRDLLVEEAEGSRERPLMAMTYNAISGSYLSFFQNDVFLTAAKSYADKCLQVANESGLNAYKVAAYVRYAAYYVDRSDNRQALDYGNQAISAASAEGSDSLLSIAYQSIASIYDDMANRLSCFQALLNEREFAEKSKVHTLIIKSYFDLGDFYAGQDDYEKAKDFYALALEKSRQWQQPNLIFRSLRDLGRTYFTQKNEPLGLAFENKALAYADSVRLPNLKIQAYIDLLNHYFNNADPNKGFAFLKAHPELMDFIRKIGLEYQINKLFAVLEKDRNQYDSAYYYLRLAAPKEYGQSGNFGEKMQFTYQIVELLQHQKKFENEKDALLLIDRFADSAQNLYYKKNVSLDLDSVYEAMGDYKNAQHYLGKYIVYRDSLESLSKQKDLVNIEIENANHRATEQKLADEEATRTRNNVEYLGITAAIASVFILLVLFGVFRISPAVIKALGFFAFIFLFEFIVLLLDQQIHEFTHGEPWKVLGVKILIISLLLPFHHWLEEKMLHYLTKRVPGISKKQPLTTTPAAAEPPAVS